MVATRGEADLGWRNVESSDDILATVSDLRGQPGINKVLVAGSISVVRQLLAAGLLDELRLLVHPVAACRGERLFRDADQPQPLKLLRSAIFPTGVVQLVYAPAEFPSEGTYADAADKLAGADG
ncbi:MAG: dihydrofolate reductase family protein [Propionicimonas sp.]